MSNRIATKRRTKSGSPVRSMKCYASVAEMPKVNSAKLTRENRVCIHPICQLDSLRHMTEPGWKIIGWADAPWRSALGQHAIVYEKLSAADSGGSLDTHRFFEPGLYWGHGDATKMQFVDKLPTDMEDELGPWVRRHNGEDSAGKTERDQNGKDR